MHDSITRASIRSKIMRSIKSSGNKSTEGRFAELARVSGIEGVFVRSILASPADLCSPRLGIALFLNGCFWHGCTSCYPVSYSGPETWGGHLFQNRARDLCDYLELGRKGWKVYVLWEHELKLGHLPERFVEEILLSGSP